MIILGWHFRNKCLKMKIRKTKDLHFFILILFSSPKCVSYGVTYIIKKLGNLWDSRHINIIGYEKLFADISRWSIFIPLQKIKDL